MIDRPKPLAVKRITTVAWYRRRSDQEQPGSARDAAVQQNPWANDRKHFRAPLPIIQRAGRIVDPGLSVLPPKCDSKL
jgi:hypothetical protein